MISINLWDDYIDGKETYMYVESKPDLPLDIDEVCLKEIIEKIDPKLKPYLFYYDVINEYPTMIGTDMEDWFRSQKRWEIRIPSLTHKRREELVDELNKIEFKTMFNFYSES